MERMEGMVPEAAPQIETKDWAERSAEDFVFHRVPPVMEKTKNDFSKAYLCHTMPVQLPGGVQVEFRFEREIVHPEGPKEIRDILSFLYARGNDIIGDFFFSQEDSRSFEFIHRYIDPAYRGQRIGSLLLKKAEGWFQSVARLSGDPVTIRMEIGQRDVMRWAKKHGYNVAETDQWLLEKILSHPEKFVMVPGDENEEGYAEYVYGKMPSGRASSAPIRLKFKKVFLP